MVPGVRKRPDNRRPILGPQRRRTDSMTTPQDVQQFIGRTAVDHRLLDTA
jgi:hypothetical protein